MAEVTQTTILDIQTGQSVKSVKDLKQQIKDLKDRIVELTAAGEDCSEEYAELGTSMRQLKDINEEATRSSKDLGDQLAVVTGSMKGVAGAIGTVSGVMALMGNESEKTTKLLKTMASAMSITTGIQAMESGAKSIKALVGGMVTATKGAKTLGAALKAAFSSNPVGLLVTALTTLGVALGGMKNKAVDAANAIAEAARNASQGMNNLRSETSKTADAEAKYYAIASENFKKQIEDAKNKAYDTVKGIRQENGKLNEETVNQAYTLLKYRSNEFKDVVSATQDEIRDMRIAFYQKWGDDATEYGKAALLEEQEIYAKEAVLAQNNIEYAEYELKVYELLNRRMNEGEKNQKKYSESIEVNNEKITQLQQERLTAMNDFYTFANKFFNSDKQIYNQLSEKHKAQKEANKQAYEQAKQNAAKLLEVDKRTASDRLKLAQLTAEEQRENEQDALTERFRNMEINEGEYESGMLGIELKYYAESEEALQNYIADMEAIREKWNKSNLLSAEQKNSIFSQIDLKEMLSQIRALKREAGDTEHDFVQNAEESDIRSRELEAESEFQNRITEIQRNAYQNRLGIEEEYNADSWLWKKSAYQLQLALLQNEWNEEEFSWNTFVEENANKMAILNERLSKQLISQSEFNEQMGALGQEYVEREQQHAERTKKIDKDRAASKMELMKTTVAIESQLAGALSGILNSMADASEDNLEEQKKLRVAATWIDTIQGSIAGFVGALESFGVPYGLIVGAATAASVIAQGIAATQKIMATTKDNTPSMSSNSINTFTTPQVATIATGATNDYTDIMGNAVSNAQGQQRVYVLLNDINSAQARMVSVTQDNTF